MYSKTADVLFLSDVMGTEFCVLHGKECGCMSVINARMFVSPSLYFG